jgi:hypothetical protein
MSMTVSVYSKRKASLHAISGVDKMHSTVDENVMDRQVETDGSRSKAELHFQNVQ